MELVSCALRHDAIGEAIHVVCHDQQIARASVAILDPVGQHRLDLEIELFKSRARGRLIRSHLRGDFLEPQRAREVENLGCEPPSESVAAKARRRVDADFADAPRPSRLVAMQACVGRDLAVDLGKQRYSVCLLYTSPSPRDPKTSRMPSSA